jgi:hypothetical protein
MSYETRIKRLEEKSRINEGSIHIVYRDGDSYTLKARGDDIPQDVEMTADEFEVWQGSKSDNDVIILVSYRDEDKLE